jgi:hypothetical protein
MTDCTERQVAEPGHGRGQVAQPGSDLAGEGQKGMSEETLT